MFGPKRRRYRFSQKRSIKKNIKACRAVKIVMGDMALKVLAPFNLKAKVKEAIRIVVTRHMGRKGFLFWRIFPDKPICKGAPEIRMGKGKNSFSEWVAPIKEGTILVEVGGVERSIAKRALELAMGKLPVNAYIVVNRYFKEST